MTTVTAQPVQAPAKGILVTEKAIAKVRSAMSKEGISPEQGGLRLGVQGGGCSGQLQRQLRPGQSRGQASSNLQRVSNDHTMPDFDDESEAFDEPA